MQIKLAILDGDLKKIEKIAEILDKNHFRILELLFPKWPKRFKNIKSEIIHDKILRVQITFKSGIVGSEYPLYELNVRFSKSYLVLSIKLDEWMKQKLKKDFDLIEFFNGLGFETENMTISHQLPKQGTNGQQHTKPKKTKSRRKKPKNKTLSKSQRKERRRQLRKK